MQTKEAAEVTFHWKQGGKHVLLATSMNDWKAIPMYKDPGSPLNWHLTLRFPLNTKVEYKYVVDGIWFYDIDAPTQKYSHGINNVLTVGNPTSESTAPSASSHSIKALPSSYKLPSNIHAFNTQLEETFVEIVKALGHEVPATIIARGLSVSKSAGFEFSFPCYEVSKIFKKQPTEVASLITQKSKELDFPIFDSIEQGSGDKDKALVNFNIHPRILAAAVIGEFYFDPKIIEKDNTILVEFSSPNTNKPQHLGHVRNNCLGDAITKMFKYQGNKVITLNLVNDRGIHICKSMLAYKKFGESETPQSCNIKGDHLVGNYYVKFENRLKDEYSAWLDTEEAQTEFAKWKQSASGKRIVEKNEKERKKLASEGSSKEISDFSSFISEYKDYYTNNFSPLGKECGQMLVDWENKEPSVIALWEKMNEWVFDGFRATYDRFGIKHDFWEKESEIYQYGKDIVQKSYEDGILEKLDNGAIAIDLVDIGVLKKGSGEERKKVLLRSNGTSVYITQDIGTAITRLRKYGGPKAPQMIYVVASEQERHFQILFKIIEKLEPSSKGALYHLSYGMVLLPSGRMKSREGTVVDADNLASELNEMAYEITKEKWPSLSEQEAKFRAEKIGMAALKFYILCVGPPTNIVFDPAKSLQFTGKSGPYLLYQYARTRSIFKKAGVDINSIKYSTSDLGLLHTAEEKALLAALCQFPKDVQFACDTRDPSKVCDTIYGISQYFNAWYRLKDKHQVVNCTDPKLKTARLMLVLASGNAIKRGLNLLGIETLEQM